jgi:hypothetical protein
MLEATFLKREGKLSLFYKVGAKQANFTTDDHPVLLFSNFSKTM